MQLDHFLNNEFPRVFTCNITNAAAQLRALKRNHRAMIAMTSDEEPCGTIDIKW